MHDLLDPDLHRGGDPHEAWAWLRANDPVHFHPRTGSWFITKHEDIVAVSRDPSTFSSARGTWPEDPSDGPDAEPYPRDAFMGGSLQMLDPPEHLSARRLMQPAFSVRAVSEAQSEIDGMAREAIASLVDNGGGDVASGAAVDFALAVLARVIGVPRADLVQLRAHANVIDNPDEPSYSSSELEPNEHRMIAASELVEYFESFVEAETPPQGSLAAELCAANAAGKIDPKGVVDQLCLLVVAGQETVHNAIAGGFLAFLEHPDELAKLREDRGLVEPAVEEVLRWVSPIVHFSRFVRRASVIRGRELRPGQRVTMFYPSANRDEDVFEGPFRFDIARDPNPHLAFGTGEHFCIGAALARAAMRSFFSGLVERVGDATIAGPVTRLRSNFNNGILSLPVRLTAR